MARAMGTSEGGTGAMGTREGTEGTATTVPERGRVRARSIGTMKDLCVCVMCVVYRDYEEPACGVCVVCVA